jgi:hypothetical protein
MATKDGMVKIHRAVASEREGRVLDDNEHVHHIDEDINNWNQSNLKVLSPSEHNTEHFEGVIKQCAKCGKELRISVSHAIYERSFCDAKCCGLFQEKADWPDDAELKRLLWERPATQLARELGVTSVAIKRRCNKRGIETPPRGYWSKQKRA